MRTPAPAPATASPPDAPAPPIVISKGPFTQRGSNGGGYFAYLPVSQSPASPWAGVSKGQPVKLVFDFENFWTRDESLECPATRDHCLPASTWFWVTNAVQSSTLKLAYAVAFSADGPERPRLENQVDKKKYVAYRTVPVTKNNLAVGSLVIAFADHTAPRSTADAWRHWQLGVVERVEWDLGMLFLKELEQPFFLSAARVAVLSYEPGGEVKILDGKKRDELAVSAADVVLPQ